MTWLNEVMSNNNGGLIGALNYPPTDLSSGVYSPEDQLYVNRAFITPVGKDPYEQNVTLDLATGSTNGGTNLVFRDSSTNNFTITTVGAPSQGVVGPFNPNGYSWFFDGSSYAFMSATTAHDLTGDFTIEAWIKLTAITSAATGGGLVACICGLRDAADSTDRGYFLYISQTSPGGLAMSGSGASSQGASARYWFDLHKWYHIAVCRSGSTIMFFVNGMMLPASSTSMTINAANAGSTFRIGANDVSGYRYYFPGHINNFRLVKGTALYTSNFNPPNSPLTAVANTSVLACASNRFIDQSSNNFSISLSGSVYANAHTPYARKGYDSATEGGSFFTNSSSNYLTIAENVAFRLLTSDFTLECWIYVAGIANSGNLIGTWAANSVPGTWLLYTNSADSTVIFAFNDSTNTSRSIATGAFRLNSWNHVAVVRSGGTFSIYLNGTRGGTLSGLASVSISGSTYYNTTIGYRVGLNDLPFNGHISGLRLVKGQALYSGATFTSPTSPPTTTSQGATASNVSLLVNFTNASVTDNARMGSVTTASTSSITNSAPLYGQNVLSFNGTSDYMLIPRFAWYNIGSGPFTLEMYVYPLGPFSATQIFFQVGDSLDSMISLGFDVTTGYLSAYNNRTSITTTTRPLLNNWNHIVYQFTRSSVILYMNGVQVASTTSVAVITPTSDINVGRSYVSGSERYFKGYISNIKLTPGIVKYTKAYIPQFPNTGYRTSNLDINIDFGDTRSYSGTGSTCLDIAGNRTFNLSGTYYFDRSYAGFLYVKGSNSLTSRIYNSTYTPNFNQDFTVELLINPFVYGTSKGQGLFQSRASSAIYGPLLTVIDASNIIWYASSTGNTWGLTLSQAIPTAMGRWLHAVFTKSGNTYTIYLNGNSTSTTFAGTLVAGSGVQIGGNNDNGGFEGGIALCRFYAGYAFSLADVTNNFNAVRSDYGV